MESSNQIKAAYQCSRGNSWKAVFFHILEVRCERDGVLFRDTLGGGVVILKNRDTLGEEVINSNDHNGNVTCRPAVQTKQGRLSNGGPWR